MDETLFIYLKDFSIEVIVISLMIFLLTMIIKLPIKKATNKLSEDKRKAINTIIIFIPVILSLMLNVLYYGLFKQLWLDSVVYQSVATCYVASVVIYALYARLLIILKGFKSEQMQESIVEQKVATEVVDAITDAASKSNITCGKLDEIVHQIDSLLTARNQIVSNIALKDVANLEEVDKKLEALNKEKQELQIEIEKQQTLLD